MAAGAVRYALRLAYDGGAFRGWQRQPGLATVQGCLEEALRAAGIRAHLDAAARTDAGVHALDQVVTFTARSALSPADLRAAVNAGTPAGLFCLESSTVPVSFHARASAVSRTYVYLVGWPAPPSLEGRAWSLPDPRAFPALGGAVQEPDLALMRAALAQVLGEHDFAAFARPGEQTARRRIDPRATVREVLRADVFRAAGAPLAAVVLEGRGFLRAMVRHLVGAAVSAAVGATGPEAVTALLETPSARYRGPRAPAWGLTLARVTYPDQVFR